MGSAQSFHAGRTLDNTSRKVNCSKSGRGRFRLECSANLRWSIRAGFNPLRVWVARFGRVPAITLVPRASEGSGYPLARWAGLPGLLPGVERCLNPRVAAHPSATRRLRPHGLSVFNDRKNRFRAKTHPIASSCTRDPTGIKNIFVKRGSVSSRNSLSILCAMASRHGRGCRKKSWR